MTYEKIFDDVKKAYSKAKKIKFQDNFAFQFNITGAGEGIFYVAYRGGELEVAPYDYVDRNATLYAAGENFIKLANGKFTLEQAVSSGLINVNGDYNLALELDKLALSAPAQSEKKETVKNSKKETEKEVIKETAPNAKPSAAVASTADLGLSAEGKMR